MTGAADRESGLSAVGPPPLAQAAPRSLYPPISQQGSRVYAPEEEARTGAEAVVGWRRLGGVGAREGQRGGREFRLRTHNGPREK